MVFAWEQGGWPNMTAAYQQPYYYDPYYYYYYSYYYQQQQPQTSPPPQSPLVEDQQLEDLISEAITAVRVEDKKEEEDKSIDTITPSNLQEDEEATPSTIPTKSNATPPDALVIDDGAVGADKGEDEEKAWDVGSDAVPISGITGDGDDSSDGGVVPPTIQDEVVTVEEKKEQIGGTEEEKEVGCCSHHHVCLFIYDCFLRD